MDHSAERTATTDCELTDGLLSGTRGLDAKLSLSSGADGRLYVEILLGNAVGVMPTLVAIGPSIAH